MPSDAERERVPLPPIVYLCGIAAGFALDGLFPVRLLSPDMQVWIGAPVTIGAVILLLMGAWELQRAGTSPLHERPTTRIVPHGLYSYSRNPIYVAMTLGCVGLAILFDRAWILAGTVPAVLVIDRIVIAREEAFLTAKFGEAYTSYRAKVRRWL